MVKIQLNFPHNLVILNGYDEMFIDWDEFCKINKDYSKILSFNKEKFTNKLDNLYKSKNINKKEIELLNKKIKSFNIDTWFYIYNFFREKYIVRWEIEDILYSGKKLNNKKEFFLLQDALIQKQIKKNEYGFIKLDTLCFFENKYKEIKNIFFICQKNERKNIKKFYKKQKENSQNYLKQDIYKYYFLKKYLKVVKSIQYF